MYVILVVSVTCNCIYIFSLYTFCNFSQTSNVCTEIFSIVDNSPCSGHFFNSPMAVLHCTEVLPYYTTIYARRNTLPRDHVSDALLLTFRRVPGRHPSGRVLRQRPSAVHELRGHWVRDRSRDHPRFRRPGQTVRQRRQPGRLVGGRDEETLFREGVVHHQTVRKLHGPRSRSQGACSAILIIFRSRDDDDGFYARISFEVDPGSVSVGFVDE